MRKPLRRSRRLVLAASWQHKLKRKAARHGINTCRVLHWYVRSHATDPRAYKPSPPKIYLHLEVTSSQRTQVSELAKGLVLQHLCTHRHIGTSIMVVLTHVTCSSSRCSLVRKSACPTMRQGTICDSMGRDLLRHQIRAVDLGQQLGLRTDMCLQRSRRHLRQLRGIDSHSSTWDLVASAPNDNSICGCPGSSCISAKDSGLIWLQARSAGPSPTPSCGSSAAGTGCNVGKARFPAVPHWLTAPGHGSNLTYPRVR